MKKLIAFDTETEQFRPGLAAPPVVCLTHSDGQKADIMKIEPSKEWFYEAIQDRNIHWIGQYIAYDMVGMCNEDSRVIPHVFRAYAEDRVSDTQLRESIITNAQGTYNDKNPADLEKLAKKYLGLDISEGKRGANSWRLRYSELADIPLKDWPKEAKIYAMDDATHTLNIYLQQAKLPKNRQMIEASGKKVSLFTPEGHVVDEFNQSRADFALRLMKTWGMKVDPEAVVNLESHYETEKETRKLTLIRLGLMEEKTGKVNAAKVRETILNHFIKDATEGQKEAFQKLYEEQKQAFFEAEKEKVEEGKKKKVGNWTATRHDLASASAWRRLGFKIPGTKKGQIKTDEETIAKVDNEEIQELSAYKKAAKKLSTYITKLKESFGTCVTPNYHVFKCTGRTSSSGPNIQNFPREGGERECFVPREGHYYIAADYSALELRSWAQACVDLGLKSDMAEALRNDIDPHSKLGAKLLGVPYDDFLDKLAGNQGEEAKTQSKLFRGCAKPPNFGCQVGMGPEKLDESARKSYGVDFKEFNINPKAVIDDWKETWGEAEPYFGVIKSYLRPAGTREYVEFDERENRVVTKFRYLKRCNVLHVGSGRIRGNCSFTEAANAYFQGLAAEGAKLALFLVAMECYAIPSSPLFGSRPCAFIHDEIIIETPHNREQGAARRLPEVMIEAMEHYITAVPVLCEADIMEVWSKKAESKIQKNGSLSIYRRKVA